MTERRTRTRIPDGMLEAAQMARKQYESSESGVFITMRIVEAALAWLSKNPNVPTDAQADDLFEVSNQIPSGRGVVRNVAMRWVSMMFAASAELLPDPVAFIECDSCRAKPGSPPLCAGCLHNREVICRSRKLGVHLSHCNFGENSGHCKYGEDETCPALTHSWSWMGKAIDRGRNVIDARDCPACVLLGQRLDQGEGTHLEGTRQHPGITRCCERDTDGDGNCGIHSAPGVYRRG